MTRMMTMKERGLSWPQQAFHAEVYFGYTSDAGDDLICGFRLKFERDRYQFKADADTSIIPPGGDVSLHRSW